MYVHEQDVTRKICNGGIYEKKKYGLHVVTYMQLPCSGGYLHWKRTKQNSGIVGKVFPVRWSEGIQSIPRTLIQNEVRTFHYQKVMSMKFCDKKIHNFFIYHMWRSQAKHWIFCHHITLNSSRTEKGCPSLSLQLDQLSLPWHVYVNTSDNIWTWPSGQKRIILQRRQDHACPMSEILSSQTSMKTCHQHTGGCHLQQNLHDTAPTSSSR